MATSPAAFDEKLFLERLLRRIVGECPRRQAGSEDEEKATWIVRDEMERLGLAGELERFRFNDNLYENLALHSGIGLAGTAVSPAAPLAGLALHLAAGTSMYMDSTRRGFLLRRTLGYKDSHNLVVTLPSEGRPALRIVLLGHVDAAFTGLMFHPRFIRGATTERLPGPLRFLARGISVFTWSQFALAGCDIARLMCGPLAAPIRPLEALLSGPALITFLLNMQVVLRNEVVPGANDDLTGVAAVALLGRRLARVKPPEVEVVLVVTGAEEASMGGSQALAMTREFVWEKDRTVLIALDGLSGGRLHWFVEGEVRRIETPRWLDDALRAVVGSDPRFCDTSRLVIPIGATDAYPFQAKGWDAVGIGRADQQIGAPRHYHQPSDLPDNIDTTEVMTAIDFAEALVRQIARAKSGIEIPK